MYSPSTYWASGAEVLRPVRPACVALFEAEELIFGGGGRNRFIDLLLRSSGRIGMRVGDSD